jgi:DNA-binding IclR family transcriptional regulator
MRADTEATSTDTQPKYPIESVDNALRLLLLVKDSSSISVAEVSRALEVAPSTAHRLLAMLKYYGFVQRDPRTRHYQAGPVLTEIGLSALKDFDIRIFVRPMLETVVKRLGETAHLTVLRGSSVFFLDGVETDKVLRAGSRIGQTLPAHSTAAGKVQLALLPEEAVKELYPSERLPAVTGRSVQSRAALLRELAEVRERGYATNVGESEEHLVAVASVICDRRGTVRGAVTVAAPDVRLQASEFPRIGKALQEITAAMGAALGTGS